jgi:hypothetical protein
LKRPVAANPWIGLSVEKYPMTLDEIYDRIFTTDVVSLRRLSMSTEKQWKVENGRSKGLRIKAKDQKLRKPWNKWNSKKDVTKDCNMMI